MQKHELFPVRELHGHLCCHLCVCVVDVCWVLVHVTLCCWTWCRGSPCLCCFCLSEAHSPLMPAAGRERERERESFCPPNTWLIDSLQGHPAMYPNKITTAWAVMEKMQFSFSWSNEWQRKIDFHFTAQSKGISLLDIIWKHIQSDFTLWNL